MDSTAYLRYVMSLVAVIGLIFAALWMVRRWGAGLVGAPIRRGAGPRRLALVESLTLDAKHRLVLIRRDDREHLLVLGASTPVVVEANAEKPRFELPRSQPEATP
ncbi:conserved hypothetical protein [Candidatus Terasakiella magnetica]|nr:conserved hypothetical protein [Candidatus Terasakiella magnetica]